jgi:hypothetical protein
MFELPANDRLHRNTARRAEQIDATVESSNECECCEPALLSYQSPEWFTQHTKKVVLCAGHNWVLENNQSAECCTQHTNHEFLCAGHNWLVENNQSTE